MLKLPLPRKYQNWRPSYSVLLQIWPNVNGTMVGYSMLAPSAFMTTQFWLDGAWAILPPLLWLDVCHSLALIMTQLASTCYRAACMWDCTNLGIDRIRLELDQQCHDYLYFG